MKVVIAFSLTYPNEGQRKHSALKICESILNRKSQKDQKILSYERSVDRNIFTDSLNIKVNYHITSDGSQENIVQVSHLINKIYKILAKDKVSSIRKDLLKHNVADMFMKVYRAKSYHTKHAMYLDMDIPVEKIDDLERDILSWELSQ